MVEVRGVQIATKTATAVMWTDETTTMMQTSADRRHLLAVVEDTTTETGPTRKIGPVEATAEVVVDEERLQKGDLPVEAIQAKRS